MNEQDYIEAIEQLNLELITLYNKSYYKRYRDKKLIPKLIKTGYYKMAVGTIVSSFKIKINSIFKINHKKEVLPEPKVATKEKKRTGKKVVYTCILNDYDTLYSPVLETEDTQYIVFSDNEKITENVKVWKFRKIPTYIKKLCNNSGILINRYIKMHPHELFSNYDLALYIDGSVRVISDIASLFYKINDKTGLAMHLHPKRNDVYQEAKACYKSALGNKQNIQKLINKYYEEKFPENYGLFEATVIAIDLKSKASLEIMDNWWIYFVKSETNRDQLILTYVLWKMGYEFKDMGILGEKISLNPKFRRSPHNYNKRK